ncbi:sodium-independent sulfate anion transporter isoform X2 [Copidosoma floridanum]|uniref:sodium-independent sulfate anion transporter isoform X1 n=1 Tax=Copidosoma floridanum TaxID=29053 RepID=UPI0006C9D507|nr:sodium-independent sulfate anion transporter isoform X1 [Copidosoma floridanum]XP_023247493.1 sodium-independent sulfate anion transporter isoform X2 [Copidosoma floridanum]
MKKDEIMNGKGLDGGYVNHALSESTADLAANGSAKSYKSQRELHGSSDFVLVEDPDAGDDESKQRENGLLDCGHELIGRLRRSCSRKTLKKRLPIVNWLPKYNGQDALGDLVAGITVGLTVIPQSLAYSQVASLPAEYGLYASFLGCFTYIFFGSCKDVPFGPTAIMSLLTYQTVSHINPIEDRERHAVLLCFLVGLIELLMGVFGLGFLIDFVSGPVSSGFTSAVALIIVSSQIKDILGISAKGPTFVEMWRSIVEQLHTTRVCDAALGVSCIVFLLILRSVASMKFGPDDEHLRSKGQKVVNNFFWLTGTSRNALLVIICGAIAYNFPTGNSPFILIGAIPSGMPPVQAPPFGFMNSDNATVSFLDMCANLGNGIIVLPLIGLMEDIAICKAFANGKSVDATQELIAIGISNIGNSFVKSFPGSGSLSRSAVNNASGVRTPLGGIYTGFLVILALKFFTPYFYYIPKATLAAIIIAAVIFMVEVKVIKPMWRTKKSDLIPGVGTFIACLALQLEYGIAIGIGINVLFILYHAARPKISIEKLKSLRGVDYLMLTPDRCLIFPSVDYVRNLVTKYSLREGGESTPVVIDCSHIYGADFTAAKVVESLTKDFAARGQPLFFYNLKPSVYAVFEGVAPKDFVVYYTQEGLDELLKERATHQKQVLRDVIVP